MRTPRPINTRRGVTTLIGNGWLHESPKNLWPRAWDIRGKSALRKCMFLPVPPGIKELAPNDASPAVMPRPPKIEQPIIAHRHDPAKDVQMFAAVSREEVLAAKRRELYAAEKAKLLGRAPHATAGARAWYEDPVALGTLLIMFPPIGLAALWSSKRYSNDARWALTVMTGLVLCLAAAVTVSIVALRR